MSFNRLDPQDFVVSADSVSSTVWTGNQPTLTTFFTTVPRNKIHIRLETDLVKVLDGIKDLSSTLLRSADSKKMLTNI